jgi:hypothetical protein
VSRVASQPGFPARVGLALAHVAAADFLLYDQPWALSLTLLFGLVGATVLAIHRAMFLKGGLPIQLGLLIATLLPLIENVSGLSVSVATALLAVFALSVSGRLDPLKSDLPRIGKALLAFLVVAPFRMIRDTFRWRRVARRLGRRGLRFAVIAVWIMPLALGAVFLALFGAANPVIDYWLSLIDLWKLLDLVELDRIVFWAFFLACIWAFLRPRLPYFFRRLPRLFGLIAVAPKPLAQVEPGARQRSAAETFEDLVFGRAAILRALILFNLMFAVETILDAAYLWGGVTLPDGLSYASYAHRGAYPLIVTALLAALFVLLALKPGSANSFDRLIRALVYAFVAQNILLVISSIFRLDLYVGIYALTYWRVAAFIWMGLVAIGLALISARIALGKSNKWLSSANLLALSITLYACCFINFAALIARYNVEHSYEMTGQSIALDGWYTRELGPQAFPAIDEFLAGRDVLTNQALGYLAEARANDEEYFRRMQMNWRSWSFRDWRLMRYLDERTANTE